MERHLTTTKRNSPGCSDSAEKRPFRSSSDMTDVLQVKLTEDQEAKREERQQVANIAQTFQNILQV